MSAQLSQTLKDSKLSFKLVLEHLYEKDAELVNKMITELETNKPAKKTMTQDEKDERKRVTKHKNAHIKKFIEDMGGETRVTETQIKEEKKKYDAKRRESKKVKADESNASNEEPTKAPVKAPVKAPLKAPVKAPVKAFVESMESDDDSDPFELEEETVSDVEEQEPPKVTPKKTKKEKIPNAPKKASKKDKSPKRTTDTDSDQE
jgi:hypothetical protein